MRHLTLLIAAALFAPAAQATFNITAFLTCIDVDPSSAAITAYFGYESFEPAITQILLGIDNRFVPPPANRQQPVLFFPGYHEKAFRITYPSGTLLYIFNGAGVTVTAASPRCVAPPAAVQLPPAALSIPYFQRLGAVGAKGNLSWLINGPPSGLSLSQDGVLTGTPLQAGFSTFTVSATDGIATATTTYGLTVNAGLSISDPLSTRPPGFVPQFRTVVQTGASNTALANCDATEFVVTGGGSCAVPNQNTVQGRVASSQASANGWAVACSGGTATAMAVCSLK